jgi:transposase
MSCSVWSTWLAIKAAIAERADQVKNRLRRGSRGNGLALGRFSMIYVTPPCVITPRSPVQGSRAVPEHLCLTRPYVPKARTLGSRGGPPAFDAAAYKRRNVVQRAFCYLRLHRAVAARYDKRHFV